MLDPRWNTFLVLCETMNYTRAAERLCLTQPAVTHHIHYLEDHYGCRLFSYEGKVLRLTEAGVKLREYTRSLAYNSRKVEESMMAPKPLSLRIGASKTIGEFVVAPKVERFLRDYPEASFSLSVDNTQVLLRMLEAGKLDFVLVEGFFEGSRYETTLYRKEEFFGICPPGHRFAGRAISLTELESERILIREPGSGTRAIFEEALRRENRTLKSYPNVATISDFSTIKSLVADGLGVSFLYAPAVSGELERGELVRFDLAGLPMSGAFSFVCLKDNLFAADWIAWMQ
ncbi:LysR family transcriptional regulator [Allofournierella massiliensis]|uniref:DNA-binding transcriptional LysR family regulator n=1 Tax=Allofournierella massiliensis TaxID=1650663 RepID=A0A4R1QU04_9FIRM|nr:LysR family transcriptional regulator [Fournierella massiliensis]TCL57439.1 DNA-binding transcriptional LysR family regulator [Fournierella massiliensis]